MQNNQNGKSLLEAFKELEQSKNRQIEEYKTGKRFKEENIRKKSKDKISFQIKQRTKKENLKLVFIGLMISIIIYISSSNYIFAKGLEPEKNEPIGSFEKNSDVTDVYEIVSQNISTSYQKEVADVEEEIEFETEYVNDKNLPKGEQVVTQEGVNGKKTVTYVRSYENNEMTDETAIGSVTILEPIKETINVGTSDVLKNYNIHIGDLLYAKQDLELKKETNDNSESLITIPNKYDVKTLEMVDETWIKVSYSEKIGYIKTEDLTSETLTPGAGESCRKQKILNSVDENMELNKPSGMLEKDFQKALSNKANDTNNVFKENYKAFYEVESKYNINGVFAAAIAIHESNWGKSKISLDKKNLFGFGAYDASPYESAVTFETYSSGINTVASWLSINYINPAGTILPNGEVATGKFYNGSTVAGVNKKYATDTNWKNGVFKYMQDIYNSI